MLFRMCSLLPSWSHQRWSLSCQTHRCLLRYKAEFIRLAAATFSRLFGGVGAFHHALFFRRKVFRISCMCFSAEGRVVVPPLGAGGRGGRRRVFFPWLSPTLSKGNTKLHSQSTSPPAWASLLMAAPGQPVLGRGVSSHLGESKE